MWPSIGDILCDPSCNPRARGQLVQGRFDLCLQTQFTGSMIAVYLFLVSAPWSVRLGLRCQEVAVGLGSLEVR